MSAAPGIRSRLWKALATRLSNYDLSKVEVRIASKADERRWTEPGWLFYVRHDGQVKAYVCTHQDGFSLDHGAAVVPDAAGVAEYVAPMLESLLDHYQP